MITEIFVPLFLVWFIWYIITPYIKRRNMPPGPFLYPFVGNIPQILSADPLNPLGKISEKYGDIFTVTFPKGNAVFLSTAALVREARGAGKQEDLAGRLPEFIYPFNAIVGKDLLACDYSSVYRFRKRVFVSAMHVFGAGKELASTRAGHAVDIAIKAIENEPGRHFSPKELFSSSIVVQVWEWLTSKKVALNDPIVKNINEFINLFNKQPFLYQLLPFLGSLSTQLSRDIKRAQHIRNMIFPPEYRSHQESYVPGVVRDLTDSFIRAYEKEIAKEIRKDIVIGSKDDIPGLMLDVAVGGSDNTSTSLSWFFLYMVLYPDVQRKIHEELDVVVGKERVPSWKDAENLSYLQATLCEVQRSMITLVGTNAIRDTTIAGYHIPKGTFVGLNLSKVHHEEREWPEPEKFKPERFLDSDGSKFVGWNKLHGFLPFGFGRRECPGQSLAKIMMFSFASALLHRYDIELPDGAEMPTINMSTPQVVSRPNDFLVVAKPRELEIRDYSD